jgi:hypothetical protein
MSRDLFGFDDPTGPPKGSVALALVLHDQTDAAWLLGETNDRRDAKWAPKSKVKRGEGRDENVWTMPAWLASDRGWT